MDIQVKPFKQIFLALIYFCFFMQNVYSQVSKTEIAVSNAILDSYTGRFAVSSNFVLEFKREGGYLILAIGGQAPIKLTPESQNKFFIQEQPEITVEFGKGSNGFIDKAILTQGRILVANKIGVEDLYNPEKQYSAELYIPVKRTTLFRGKLTT